MKKRLKFLLTASAILLAGTLYTIKGYADNGDLVPGRWYTKSQLIIGQAVFKNNCMVCHGDKGQGLAEDWKKPLADGSYPPPPVNGTAHTWHHPMSQLLRSIKDGGIPLGGKMPAFGATLSKEERIAAIAYIHSLWPKDIYEKWINHGGLEN